MKTSHFEGRIALSAEETAQGRDEHTQREPATFDFDLGSAWLVASADCARTGPQPGDGGPVCQPATASRENFAGSIINAIIKKARSLSLRAFESNLILLRQNMGVGGEGTQRASRSIAHSSESVNAASRTWRKAGGRVQLDVGRQVGVQSNCITGLFAFFQREFIRGGVNLAQVVDASIHLRGGAGFHEVGNGDRRQQADNGHDNHDFHQGETCLAEGFSIFHFPFSFHLMRREQINRRVTISTFLPTRLPVATARYLVC